MNIWRIRFWIFKLLWLGMAFWVLAQFSSWRAMGWPGLLVLIWFWLEFAGAMRKRQGPQPGGLWAWVSRDGRS